MFSNAPFANESSAPAARSSRRRPRPLSNEGSSLQPKAKRQRSEIVKQTFTPPDGAPEMEEAGRQMIPMIDRDASRDIQGARREIAVRGKMGKSSERASKGDGSILLTTNDVYAVSKLPAFPDILRTETKVPQHGSVNSENGYALTVTHAYAIVWPYAVNIPSPETSTFKFQEPSQTSDPLPLASLVSASASSTEPGLVVIFPTTGKIQYWESVASAATLDLLHGQGKGVSFTITGMLSGERVVQILNAEPAGFMLGTSTGRLAYMSVRDGQGRPAISVQILTGSGGNTGILSSFRSLMSKSQGQGSIAAVRAGRTQKVGERNVVMATSKGRLQSWKIHRGGHTSSLAEAEGRDGIVEAIKQAIPARSHLLAENFEILDFTFTPRSISDDKSEEEGGLHLLLLTSLTERQIAHYTLVDVVLSKDDLRVGNIRSIKSYTTPMNPKATSKARLYLPNPALVGYAVFDKAVVVISMAAEESPESQLRSESRILPQGFEDVVDFRGDLNTEIVGSGMEEPHSHTTAHEETKWRRHKTKHPAVVLLVKAGGIVRVAATDVTRLTISQAHRVTAKSKLEQAVFFGTLEQNPLSFAGRPEMQFSSEEVGEAALALSKEVLKSTTPYIPSLPSSTDQNLRKRSATLHALAQHLQSIGVNLDRRTKWKLLLDAEKMAAATLVWQRYDASLKKKPEGMKRGLLMEIIEFIHEDYKSNPVAEAGELDRVRHWFIDDVWNLEIALPWAYQVIKYSYQNGEKDIQYVLEMVAEANELVNAALGGAFEFREANMSLYGLGSEVLEHGVLTAGYEGLPEFWTSTFYLVENIRHQNKLSAQQVQRYWRQPAMAGHPDPELVNRLRLEQISLTDIAIRTSMERVRWDFAQNLPDLTAEAIQLAESHGEAHDESLRLLAANLQLPDEAIDLAEKHELLPSLAAVLLYEQDVCATEARQAGLHAEELEYLAEKSTALQARIGRCFTKFGTKWAAALYEHYIASNEMAALLNTSPEHQKFLTAFLRGRPEFAKVAWIHEINGEGNYDEAAQDLLALGLEGETDVWSKRVELSLGLLAHKASNHPVEDVAETAAYQELALINIQGRVYDHILPAIDAAIDDKAEVQLALEAYGDDSLKKRPALSLLLEESMGHLVRHEAMKALPLVDLLTLMKGGGQTYQEVISQEQFYLALEAVRRGVHDKEEKALVQRIIWRRCFLRDNWAELNDTELKDDQHVLHQVRDTALYLTFRACFKGRIFEKDATIKPLEPKEVLGAGTEEVDSRFSRLDASSQRKIMKDMQAEDEALLPYIERCRLDKWHLTTLDLAREDFRHEVAEENKDGEQMKQGAAALQELERGLLQRETSRADQLLHEKPRYKPKARGKLEGKSTLRSSVKLY